MPPLEDNAVRKVFRFRVIRSGEHSIEVTANGCKIDVASDVRLEHNHRCGRGNTSENGVGPGWTAASAEAEMRLPISARQLLIEKTDVTVVRDPDSWIGRQGGGQQVLRPRLAAVG